MPVVLKMILNLIFFVIYVIVFSLIAGVCIWMYANLTGSDINNFGAAFYDRFQMVFIFLILIVTILLKKYFYLPLATKEELVVVED